VLKSVFWGSGRLTKSRYFGRLQLLQNIGVLREIEPLREYCVEVAQLILDELSDREMQRPKRVRAVPIAAFEGVISGVAERPNKNPICEFWCHYATLINTSQRRLGHLDEGHMWPTAFALQELTAAEEAKIGTLVKRAVSED
jgi:hypothetical protein